MRGQFYSMWLPTGFKEKGRIVINEMINILLALRVLGNFTLRDSKVLIWCDNSAVVEVMDRNRTRRRTGIYSEGHTDESGQIQHSARSETRNGGTKPYY